MNEMNEIVVAARRLVERTQWRPLLDSMFFPVILVDRDGRIAMANSLALDMFDYPESLLLGHLVEELMPERFREHHVMHRTRYFENPVRRAMGSGLDLFMITRHGHGRYCGALLERLKFC